MKRVSLPLNIDRSSYNTSNHHDRDPYYINDETDTLIIDEEWWSTQVPQRTKDLLAMRELEFVVGPVPIPHEHQFDFRLVAVYQAYQEAFEYQEWSDYVQNGAKLVAISPDEKFDSKIVTELVKYAIGENKQPLFVRTGATSGKNTVPIKPCTSGEEVVAHLMCNPEIEMREWCRVDKATFIVLVPWNNAIDSRNEFRLFVANNRVVALSPQRYWECHDYTSDELDAVEEAVLKAALDSPYNWFIVDAWVDFEKRKLHVIEFNCFGDHSGAGSSLFNWIEDHDLLYGKREGIEFRFLFPFNTST